MANPDPQLGESTAGQQYQVTVENFFGEVFEFRKLRPYQPDLWHHQACLGQAVNTKSTNDPHEIRSEADDAFERGDFEAAHVLYRQLAGNGLTRTDLASLISAEQHSVRLFCRRVWRETGLWYVGFALADLVAPDDEALQILAEILLKEDLEPTDRWRVRCKKVNIAIDRGPHRVGLPPGTSWPALVEDFLAAWNHVEGLADTGRPLRQGMAQALARGQGENARAFLDALTANPDFPEALRRVVQTKMEQLAAVSSVG